MGFFNLVGLTQMALYELRFCMSEVSVKDINGFIEAYLCGEYQADSLDTLEGWAAKGYRVKDGSASVLLWENIELEGMVDFDCSRLYQRLEKGTTKEFFFSCDVVKI